MGVDAWRLLLGTLIDHSYVIDRRAQHSGVVAHAHIARAMGSRELECDAVDARTPRFFGGVKLDRLPTG